MFSNMYPREEGVTHGVAWQVDSQVNSAAHVPWSPAPQSPVAGSPVPGSLELVKNQHMKYMLNILMLCNAYIDRPPHKVNYTYCITRAYIWYTLLHCFPLASYVPRNSSVEYIIIALC